MARPNPSATGRDIRGETVINAIFLEAYATVGAVGQMSGCCRMTCASLTWMALGVFWTVCC